MKKLLFLLVLFTNTLKSQDIIIRYDKPPLYGKILYENKVNLTLESTNARINIPTTYSIYKQDVYSYTKKGIRIIRYKPQPIIGNVYTIPEMELYMEGRTLAYKKVKSFPIAAIGYWLGFGYTLYNTRNLTRNPTIGGLFMNVVFVSALTIRTNIGMKDINNPYTRVGFYQVKKGKHSKAAFLGSILGTLTIYTISFLK